VVTATIPAPSIQVGYHPLPLWQQPWRTVQFHLGRQRETFIGGRPNLRLVRDYANTRKHAKRRNLNDLIARIAKFTTDAHGPGSRSAADAPDHRRSPNWSATR
jgi:hypothetical protein